MTHQRAAFFPLILFFSLIAAWVYFSLQPEHHSTLFLAPMSEASYLPPQAQPSRTPTSSSETPFSSSPKKHRLLPPQKLEPQPLEAPSLNVYRNEIQADPHSSPESLLRFARSLGKRMKRAQTQARYAEELMKELEEIIINKGGRHTPCSAKRELKRSPNFIREIP